MREDISIKKEAVEVMCKMAGKLAYKGLKTSFDFEEEDGKYNSYFLVAESLDTYIPAVTYGSDGYDESLANHHLDIKLHEAVSLYGVWVDIRNGCMCLSITFDFTDFVNANIENNSPLGKI